MTATLKMLGVVTALLALGAVILLAGIAMDQVYVQLFLMRNVTMKPLGSLAPGYAGTVRGYRVYSGLVRSFGAIIAGVGLAAIIPVGALLFVVGVAAFAYYSVRAIRGEVVTYRALKR